MKQMLMKSQSINPIVIKLGGSALFSPEVRSQIIQVLAELYRKQIPLVVVHGGGPAINEALTARGITWNFANGLRVTSPEMMDIIEEVLCGKVNRSLVRALYSEGVWSQGLSGTDEGMLRCTQKSTELGLVGEIAWVNPMPIFRLLESKPQSIPVIAPIGIGADGQAFNINADWAAARIAEGIQAQSLIYLTDQDGVLNADGELVSTASHQAIDAWIESGMVQGGMRAKVESIQHALESGVEKVLVLNGKKPSTLSEAIQYGNCAGTFFSSAEASRQGGQTGRMGPSGHTLFSQVV